MATTYGSQTATPFQAVDTPEIKDASPINKLGSLVHPNRTYTYNNGTVTFLDPSSAATLQTQARAMDLGLMNAAGYVQPKNLTTGQVLGDSDIEIPPDTGGGGGGGGGLNSGAATQPIDDYAALLEQQRQNELATRAGQLPGLRSDIEEQYAAEQAALANRRGLLGQSATTAQTQIERGLAAAEAPIQQAKERLKAEESAAITMTKQEADQLQAEARNVATDLERRQRNIARFAGISSSSGAARYLLDILSKMQSDMSSVSQWEAGAVQKYISQTREYDQYYDNELNTLRGNAQSSIENLALFTAEQEAAIADDETKTLAEKNRSLRELDRWAQDYDAEVNRYYNAQLGDLSKFKAQLDADMMMKAYASSVSQGNTNLELGIERANAAYMREIVLNGKTQTEAFKTVAADPTLAQYSGYIIPSEPQTESPGDIAEREYKQAQTLDILSQIK